MSSAAPSRSPKIISGPVAVCVDRPVLSLDRPFTYELSEDLAAGVGSLVQVPFHGRVVRGWVLGATDDLPKRMLGVKEVVSPVRFFDERLLFVARWVSERYVAPLAAVLGAMSPPRVAGEEVAGVDGGADLRGGRFAPSARSARLRAPAPVGTAVQPRLAGDYTGGPLLLDALRGGSGAFVLRPAPEDEVGLAVECVSVAVAAQRSAIVLVPEADPLPATAAAIRDAFGDLVVMYVGGSKRARYRMWLDIAAGMYRGRGGDPARRVRAGAAARAPVCAPGRATRCIGRSGRRTSMCGMSRWPEGGSRARSS